VKIQFLFSDILNLPIPNFKMSTSTETSPLPPINRYITTNDATGNAVLDTTIAPSPVWTSVGTARFFLGYATKTFPVQLTASKDVETYASFLHSPPGLTVSGGTVLRIVDMAPRAVSSMHRTTSLDYGVVLEGEVELILDGGDKRILRRGDTCVQRASNHAWRNASETEWSRMLYVLVEAVPPVVEGKTLGEELGVMPGVRASD